MSGSEDETRNLSLGEGVGLCSVLGLLGAVFLCVGINSDPGPFSFAVFPLLLGAFLALVGCIGVIVFSVRFFLRTRRGRKR